MAEIAVPWIVRNGAEVARFEPAVFNELTRLSGEWSADMGGLSILCRDERDPEKPVDALILIFGTVLMLADLDATPVRWLSGFGLALGRALAQCAAVENRCRRLLRDDDDGRLDDHAIAG